MRKTKWVVWFHNMTDSRDDEWTSVWAQNRDEATKKGSVKMDRYRFTLGRTYTIKEFRKDFGKDWPLGKM